MGHLAISYCSKAVQVLLTCPCLCQSLVIPFALSLVACFCSCLSLVPSLHHDHPSFPVKSSAAMLAMGRLSVGEISAVDIADLATVLQLAVSNWMTLGIEGHSWRLDSLAIQSHTAHKSCACHSPIDHSLRMPMKETSAASCLGWSKSSDRSSDVISASQ